MNTKRILSGYEIVAKGATKIESTLPEAGVKDVFPNKSWLEDKQIQAAIEARKHIIEVERIDKSGALNHAEWREDLQLAEVTQNVGSCWQYLGEMKDKKLYLKPEEALFLLEINSLCLKHDDVKVSLQQAYTLLLRDKIALLQYKVYASLSRVGYRVFRHSTPEPNYSDHRENSSQNIEKNIKTEEVSVGTSGNTDKDENVDQETDYSDLKQAEASQDIEITQEVQKDSANAMNSMQDENTKFSNQIKQKKVCNFKQLQRLTKRQLKPCNAQILHEYFEDIPELLGNNIVDIKAPDKNVLPNSIILTKPIYKVNIASLKKKERTATPSLNETNNYNVNDEVNGSHIRRLRSTSNRTEFNCTPQNAGFPQNTQYRPFQWRPRQPFYNHNYNFIYNYMRPQNQFIYSNFNMLFQRPFLPGWHFAPNFNFYPQPQNNFWRPNLNNQQTRNNFCRPNLNNQQTQSNFWRPNLNNTRSNNNRKRSRKSAKKQHLNGILKLAAKLKRLVLLRKSHEGDIYALNKLIHTYNKTYNTKIRLNDQFEIIIEETVVDTITLDDDDEGPSSKRLKPDPSFEENLDNLKLFALKIKDLEHEGKSTGKHRRAFSKLLKAFNDSYNEEYYLNEYYEIACRNQIDLDTTDSDSDLDCVIEETPSVSSKKLKNPFNILKRLSETQKPSSEVDVNLNENTITNKKYSEVTLNTFSKGWLPHEDDFGRAEIIRKDDCNNDVIDIRREEFLYDFIKIQSCKYDNWLDLKNSFLNSIQAAIVEFQHNMPASAKMEIDSIVKIEDCSNMESVLKKLSIIKTDRRVAGECNLTIDFDVYNRDVQNFRKSNRPTPHFRVICLNESTNLPPGEQIAALHSKYGDQVATVFAIVGLDSISYVQINPTDLPVYISNVNSI